MTEAEKWGAIYRKLQEIDENTCHRFRGREGCNAYPGREPCEHRLR